MDNTVAGKKITRGISEEFAKALAASKLHKLYDANNHELFWGIRNGYVNLYYNAASVCKVKYDGRRKKLNCSTHKKYIADTDDSKKSDYRAIPIQKIVDDYQLIKKVINSKNTPEKIMQQKLLYLNNSNEKSKWFCIDIEYVKQRNSSADEKDKKYGRFDIVAISKEKPRRVALIEFKYGIGAIGGSSGIVKHAEDYTRFNEDNILGTHMRKEIIDIVANLNTLEICSIKIEDEGEIVEAPEFYFITLDNNPKTKTQTTPKMTMGGYVFNRTNPKFMKIGSRKQASNTVESKCGDITDPANQKLYARFLFSRETIDTINSNPITDIIDDPLYDREF